LYASLSKSAKPSIFFFNSSGCRKSVYDRVSKFRLAVFKSTLVQVTEKYINLR
jgi:hypothetical protein